MSTAQLCKFTKKSLNYTFKMGDFILCELYLNETMKNKYIYKPHDSH